MKTDVEESDARPRAPKPPGPLSIPSFRWLIVSLFTLTLASQIQGVVVAWQIYAITKDPLALGLIGLAEALPFLAVALFAGHLADTRSRWGIALASIAALLACGLALLLLTLAPPFAGLEWAIYGVIVASGVARSFLGPARVALSAEIVPRELFPASVTWRTAIWQVGAVSGPAVGGGLYALGEEKLGYGVTVALIVAALVFQVAVRVPPRPVVPSEDSIWTSLREGLGFVLSQRVILSAISLDLFAVLFGGAVALLPIYADEILKVGPEGLGLLRAAPAAGAVVMSVILTHRAPFESAGRTLLVSVAAFGACMIGFGVSTSFWLSLGLLALSGAVDYISVVIRHTLVQVLTPERMLGRISSVNAIFIGSSNEIGAFESGAAARLLGTVPSVVVGGAITLGVVAITAWRVPELRQLRRIAGG